jgi:hypothetical protein
MRHRVSLPKSCELKVRVRVCVSRQVYQLAQDEILQACNRQSDILELNI